MVVESVVEIVTMIGAVAKDVVVEGVSMRVHRGKKTIWLR